MEQVNQSIWHKFGLCICWIFNQIPVCHVSRDEEFDSISSLTNLRVSLVSIPLGDKYLYFFSYRYNSGFRLISFLKISDIQPPRQLPELEASQDNFINLDDDQIESKSQLRIEFLKHKHTECQNSINILNNKVNSYIAIALVYAGLFTFLFQSCLKFLALPLNWLMWILLALSGINLINVLILLRRYLQVKGALKSKFSSFKEAPSWKLLAKSIYLDWLTAQDEQVAAATIVKNIEKYFIRSIIISALLLALTTLLPYSHQVNSQHSEGKQFSTEFIILSQSGDFSPQEFLKFSEKVSSKSNVIFIHSKSNVVGEDTVNFIVHALKLSNRHSVITVNDEFFDRNTLLATIQEEK